MGGGGGKKGKLRQERGVKPSSQQEGKEKELKAHSEGESYWNRSERSFRIN